jgi:hypothetical protein
VAAITSTDDALTRADTAHMAAQAAQTIKILLLAADPIQPVRLQLDEEVRAIDQALRQADYRDRFELEQHWAVRAAELPGLLLRHRPHIVHFCGHGSGNDEIILLDDFGNPQTVTGTALSQLFAQLKNEIRCVILNACYTETQARAIATHIDVVIGMSSAITDVAARHFATAFYQALGYGRSVQSAFELGCAQIALTNLPEEDIPRLLATRHEPSRIFFVEAAKIPDMESRPAPAAPPTATGERDARPADTQTHQRNRRNMLRLVHEYWVEGVLQNSLYKEVLFSPGIVKNIEAVHPHLWDMVVRQTDHQNLLLPPGSDIAEVFEQMGRSLLLLGEPGSGKTTSLLAIARSALARAAVDPAAPIPVVFDLSSWGEKRQHLDAWLVEELDTKYNIPRRTAKDWVANDQLVLLLDSLDQVRTPYRDDCVRAINAFCETHDVEICVCSRTSDYERIGQALQLHAAVVLQPLTTDQVEHFLTAAGLANSTLANDVRNDPVVNELARSPLMLSILCLTYDEPAGQDPSAGAGGIEERRQRIFEHYVDRMLMRQPDAPYPPEQTRHWLSQIAQGMRQHGQGEFLIEQLQPSWLANGRTRVLYEACVRLSGGLLFVGGCLAATALAALLTDPQKLVADSMVGLQIGLVCWLPFAIASILARFVYGWIATLCAVILLILVLPTISLARDWQGALLLGLLIGLPAGLAGVGFGARETIRLADRLTWSWWRGVYGIGIAVCLAALFAVALQNLRYGINLGAYIVPIAFTLGGFTRFEQVIITNTPNYGIRRTAYNALFAGSLIFFSAFVAIAGWDILVERQPLTGLKLGLTFGVPLGLIAAFAQGAVSCLQHGWLRLFMAWSRRLPWNCRKFLDFATDHILLHKVGGGYRFVHTLLLEHFLQERRRS